MNSKTASQKHYAVTAFFILTLLICHCGDTPSGPNGGSIIGSWEKQVENLGTITLSLLDNGTFTAAGVSGTYTLSGAEITFIDDDCGEDEGNYSYSTSNDKLTFSLIADNCEGRSELVPGTWTKK